MRLFLDSADLEEIESALAYGFIKGLTTTPTFMRNRGVTDIDGMIARLSKLVPELHVEALGENSEEIVKEARRIAALPLSSIPVFKIPISMEGLRACRILKGEGHRVNIHLVYTLNQAWLAMEAGASYVCPLLGRMHDQGLDAVSLLADIVALSSRNAYDCSVMASSIRNPEHVRQAALAGAGVCTVPWRVLGRLCDNPLTERGTRQFFEDTRMMTLRVLDVIRPENPVCTVADTVSRAMILMTESRTGAVSIVDNQGALAGVFTDGDIRRKLSEIGEGLLELTMKDAGFSTDPLIIESVALLNDAFAIFEARKVDNLVVVTEGKPVGILDIQDLITLDRFKS